MMDKFDKLLEKKGKKISPLEQKAKMDVLSDLKGQASDMMGEKLGGIKKVSVAAPDKEGLKEGLEKAEELLEEMPNGEEKPEGELSLEEIEAKIQELMMLKEKLLAEQE